MAHNPYLHRGVLTGYADLVGRRAELAECFSLIASGDSPQNVSLYGDRWIGKSSLLMAVQRRLPESVPSAADYVCAHLDVQGIGTPRTFYSRLAGALAMAGQRRDLRVNETAAALRDAVETLSRSSRLVVLLDGFDAITRNPNFPVEFFSFLRSLPLMIGSRLGWVLTSSRRLTEVCHSTAVQGSPFFNIFSDRLLGALTQDEAYELIVDRSRAAGHSLEPFASAIEEVAGRTPLFLQMVCSYAYEQAEAHGGRVDMAGVRQKFKEESRSNLEHLWSRLSDVERAALRAVGQREPMAAHAPGLLSDLVQKGFLAGPSLAAGGFAFGSSVLAEFVQEELLRPQCAVAGQAAAAPVRAPAPEPPGRLRVFVSYSHRNRRACQQIMMSLQTLSLQGIDFWFDEQLNAGEVWDDRIRAEMRRADVVLVLVSPEYLASAYCMESEAAHFIRARATGGLIVFPLLLSPCALDEHDWLAQTHRLPREGSYSSVAGNKARRDALLLDVRSHLKALAHRKASTAALR